METLNYKTPVDVEEVHPHGDYRFKHSLSDANGHGLDIVQIGPDANEGNIGFTTDDVDGKSRVVLHYPRSVGLSVPVVGLLSDADPGIYTIAVLFKPESTSGYVRIIDLKDGTSDSGLYIRNTALKFWPLINGPGGALDITSYRQVVLTRDAAGRLSGYVDGALQWTVADSWAKYGVATNVLRFFRDNEGGWPDEEDNEGGWPDEESAGNVARIRVFPKVLCAAEIRALENGRASHIGS